MNLRASALRPLPPAPPMTGDWQDLQDSQDSQDLQDRQDSPNWQIEPGSRVMSGTENWNFRDAGSYFGTIVAPWTTILASPVYPWTPN